MRNNQGLTRAACLLMTVIVAFVFVGCFYSPYSFTPSEPVIASAVWKGSDGAIEIDWDAFTDADSYSVYYAAGNVSDPSNAIFIENVVGTAFSWTVPGTFSMDDEITFWVRAHGSFGTMNQTGYSNPVVCTVGTTVVPDLTGATWMTGSGGFYLSVPSATLTATGATRTTTKFSVYASLDGTTDPNAATLVATELAASGGQTWTLSVTDGFSDYEFDGNELPAGTDLNFWVKAYHDTAFGTAGVTDFSAATSGTVGLLVPKVASSVVTQPVATDASTNSITFTWDPVEYATQYNVFTAVDSYVKPDTPSATITNLNQLTYEVGNLSYGARPSFWVDAVMEREGGKPALEAKMTTNYIFPVICEQMPQVTLTNCVTEYSRPKITVSWDAITVTKDIVGYIVSYSHQNKNGATRTTLAYGAASTTGTFLLEGGFNSLADGEYIQTLRFVAYMGDSGAWLDSVPYVMTLKITKTGTTYTVVDITND